MSARISKVGGCLLILIVASCKLEPCKDVVCVNGQALEDGKDCICLCDLGWDGNECTQEDKCVTQNIVCLNNGSCNSNTGKCNCDAGYEGDSCQIKSRDKFLDNGDTSIWSAVDTCRLCETCTPVIYIYDTLLMSRGVDNKTLEIYNLRDLSKTIFIAVNVSGNNFDQKSSFVDFGPVRIMNLEGTISNDHNTLRVTYVSDDGVPSDCVGTWNRE